MAAPTHTRARMASLRSAVVAVLLLAAMAVSVPTPATAQLGVVFVDASRPGSANTGTSWANAYTDLSTALANAGNATQLWIAEGFYEPDPTDQTASFVIPAGAQVYGGFQGDETALSQRDPAQYATILTGEINSGVESDNTENIVVIDNANAARLDGVIITGGNADGASPDGAGIRVTNSTDVAIVNTRVTNSVADGNGAAVFVENSTVALVSSQLDLNDASSIGGALYAAGSGTDIVMINTLVSRNSGAGSALQFSDDAEGFITNATVVDNTSGGGVSATGGATAVLTNSILRDNGGTELGGIASATFSNVSGGAVGANNIDADPLLAADYSLGFTSPSVDAGSSVAVPADFYDVDDDGDTSEPTPDLRRAERIAESAVDQGAIESLSCPSDIYVDQSNIGGAGTGDSWTDAFADLQDGLALATACGTDSLHFVRVAAGTYTPTTSPTDRSASFALTTRTRIIGGYAPGGSPTADPDTNLTVLSGDIVGNDGTITDIDHPNRADNSYRVVLAQGSSIEIRGVRIQGGNANGPSSPERVGGGVYANVTSSFELNDVEIRRNAAQDAGGGVALFSASVNPPTVVNSEILQNESSVGAGIAVLDGSLLVTNSDIFLNSADTGGGGIYVGENSLDLHNVLVRENEAEVGAGILLDDGTTATVLLSTIADNAAASGGAFSAADGQPFLLEMSNSIVWGNTADTDPVFANVANRDITYSTIEGGEPGVGNLASDPLFTSPISNNYRLKDASPSIDAGLVTLIPLDPTDVDDNGSTFEQHPVDLDSTARFKGFAVDHGAYESATGASCGAGTIAYVDRSNGGFQDGAGWATAFTDLQTALLKADFCTQIDEIRIAEGTYLPAATNRNISFDIRGGLTVTGGYPAGGGATSNPTSNETILSGDLQGNDDGLLGINNTSRSENSELVVELLEDSFGATTMRNLTIADGHDNSAFAASASGIHLSTGRLDGVRIERNVARSNSSSSAVRLRNPVGVQLVDTSVTGNGGAAAISVRTANFFGTGSRPSDIELVNTTIADNESGPLTLEATSNAGQGPLDVTVVNSLLVDNGGVIDVDGFAALDLHLINSTVAYNGFTATSDMIRGAASAATLRLNNSILWNDGNGFVQSQAPGVTATAANSTVSGGTISGSIDVDPEFIDPDNGNYRLAGSSDLINQGSNALLPADTADLDGDSNTSEDVPIDLDDDTRVRNGTVDIGAYEATADDLTVLDKPCVVYDSKSAGGVLGGTFDGGELRTVGVAGSLNGQGGESSCIPAGASLALVTITAVGPQAGGNLRLSAAGVAPTGGVVNYADNGLFNSNTVAVPLSADGAVDVFANGGPFGSGLPSTDVRLTVLAYADENGDQQFTPITPCAAHDSRNNIDGAGDWEGPFPAGGGPAAIDVIGAFEPDQGGFNSTCGIPTDATGIVANVVAINPADGTGWLSISPAGSPQTEPLVNFTELTPPMNNAATVVVPLDGDSVLIEVDGDNDANTQTRLVILGYTTKGGGNRLIPVDACAAFDTRTGTDDVVDHNGPRLGDQATTYQISGPIPSTQGGANGGNCNVPDGASSVLLNLVAINATGAGNLQAYATGTTPTGGVLNFAGLTPAMNNSNAVIVPLSANGELTVNVNGGPFGSGLPLTDIRGVVLGYFD